MTNLQRCVPGGEHRQVVLVEVLDGLGVVDGELVVRDLVDPCMHDLAQQLTARFATDRLGYYADGLLGLDEAKRHCLAGSPGSHIEAVARYVPRLTEKLSFPLVAGWRVRPGGLETRDQVVELELFETLADGVELRGRELDQLATLFHEL